mgnify:FL=1
MNPITRFFHYCSDESNLFNRNLQKNGDVYDQTLLWVLLGLLGLGLVMVFSASASQLDPHNFDQRTVYLFKQAKFVLFGLVLCAYLIAKVPMWIWQRLTKYILVMLLLLMCFVPFLGETVNGARRWLSLGFIKIQPSELFKLVTIMYMASFLKRKLNVLDDFKRVSWVALPTGVGIGLIYATRDLGSALVVFAIVVALLFIANLPWRWFLLILGAGVSLAVLVIATTDFRLRRFEVALTPWIDANGTGFQGLGSLLSMESGGLFGKGLGKAIFKRGFLPEAHTDFILAVIGEELGLITVALLIFTYLWIVWRALSIGKMASDQNMYFNAFIATGIGVWVAAQSFINIGVNIGLLPNKGLTLPLVSYGGSSLLVMMAAFTMLLRVDYETRRSMRGYDDVLDPRDRKQAQPEARAQGAKT